MILFGNWKHTQSRGFLLLQDASVASPECAKKQATHPSPTALVQVSTLMRNCPAPVWLSEKGMGWMELRIDPGVPSWRTMAADQESLRTEPFHRHWLPSSVFVVLVRHQKSIFSPSFGNPFQIQKPKSEFLP